MDKVATERFPVILIIIVCCAAAFIGALITVLTDAPAPGYRLSDVLEYNRSLPPEYVIQSSFDTPAKAYADAADSWAFAYTALLEGAYRRQLRADGRIASNEYVAFSEQALLHECAAFCRARNGTGACSVSGAADAQHLPAAALPDLVRAGMSKGALPRALCAYRGGGDRECAGYGSHSAGLTYTVESVQRAATPGEMKDLLYFGKRPLLLSLPQPLAQYYVPCDDARAGDSEECERRRVLCPDGSGGFCALVSFPATSALGDVRVPQEPARLVGGAPVSFLVVGYSDTFVSTYGYGRDATNVVAQGGFIVKGSNSAGFPITYYSGRASFSDAHSVCPNYRYPGFWRGSPIPCVVVNKSYSECPSKESEKKASNMATKLRCTNASYCNTEGYYTVGQLPVRNRESAIEIDEAGMAITRMFRFNEGGKLEEESVFDKVPYHRLQDLFEPDRDKEQEDCGYGFIPYEVLNKLAAGRNNDMNSLMAIQMNIKFDKESLIGNIKGSLKKLVKKSTVNERLVSTKEF